MGIRTRAMWFMLGPALLVIFAGCTQIAAGPSAENRNAASEDEDTAQAEVAQEQAVEAEPASTESISPENESAESVILAGTNIAEHSVPLADIHFDTFNGSSVPLSDISESLTLQLRDAIPPIAEPKYINVATADEWLQPEDMVIGYVDGDQALAYPARIMNYHEIVNETVNDVPVLISFCPLCNSGIVYDRRLGDQVLEFGNTSALFESDMVMYDKQTFSYWFQVGGEAIVGDLTGGRLELLPTRFMRWVDWKAAYPESQVLSRDTGFQRPYERDPFTRLPEYLNGGRFPFPVSDAGRDPTLPAGAQVISVVVNDEARAYPVDALKGMVVNDEVGAIPLAIVVDEAGTARAFKRTIGDKTVSLEWDGQDLVDAETGAAWTGSGQPLSGTLASDALQEQPARYSFWFAFIAAFPNGTAYAP